MCCNFPAIKITEGNAFTLIFPLKRRSYVAEKPIDEDIDVTRLSDVHVTLGGVEYAPTIETYGVRIDVPATLVRGTYDGLLTADYDGNAIRGAYESCVQIVAWNAQSNAQQYILGSPVATNAAYVLGYMPTDAEVEALKQQLREQIAAAAQAEAEAIAEKERYAEAIGNLDDIAQESTLTQGVSDIRNDIANIDIYTTTLAKETTAQQAAADAAAAKVAAQALSPIAQAADAYNTGKVELAANITAKGVEASASETLPQLAQKVTAISQETIILSPSEVGDMYAVQQFGSLTTPNYWNLYEVLNTLLNDGRLLKYGGILLAEYYRGYDSIALSGAGSGGAYVVSDMENGIFKMYTKDTTHTWNTEYDGKGNRWVAYCFADEYHNFDITDTNTSPRSIYIGRKVGNITCLVNSRISDIVVPDGDNSLLGFANGGFLHDFGKKICIRNIEDITTGLIKCNGVTEYIYLKAGTIDATSKIIVQEYKKNPSPSVIVEADSIKGIGDGELIHLYNRDGDPFPFVAIKANSISGWTFGGFAKGTVKNIAIIAGSGVCNVNFFRDSIIKLEYLYIGYFDTAAKSAISFSSYEAVTPALKDCLFQDGICRSINVSAFDIPENGTTNYITEHLLRRLKQDEQDCGSGVTITLGQTNLDKLTSQESIALLDDLTNIYGYTFA